MQLCYARLLSKSRIPACPPRLCIITLRLSGLFVFWRFPMHTREIVRKDHLKIPKGRKIKVVGWTIAWLLPVQKHTFRQFGKIPALNTPREGGGIRGLRLRTAHHWRRRKGSTEKLVGPRRGSLGARFGLCQSRRRKDGPF